MKYTLVDKLCCPECNKTLQLYVHNEFGIEVISGILQCAQHHEWAIAKGVPRFLKTTLSKDTLKTQRAFSHEWKMYREGERNWGQDISARRKLFLKAFGLSPEHLRGKSILDAGCGSGALSADLADILGMEVVAIDLAFGVEEAYKRSSNPALHFIQGSILELPLRDDTFDYVYCAGVLVHLRDSYEGFKSIIRTLKGGGRCFTWLYHPIDKLHHPNDLRKMQLYVGLRRFTTQLPLRVQYFLYLTLLIPFVLKRSVGALLGTDKNPLSIREKLQNLFDTFSPVYQNRHEEKEVLGWYAEQGFENIAVAYTGHYGFGVRGDKPKTNRRLDSRALTRTN